MSMRRVPRTTDVEAMNVGGGPTTGAIGLRSRGQAPGGANATSAIVPRRHDRLQFSDLLGVVIIRGMSRSRPKMSTAIVGGCRAAQESQGISGASAGEPPDLPRSFKWI